MNTLKVTPKDFFLWAGSMVALYGSVIAFIALLFQYINFAFPDPLSYQYYADPYSGGIRFAMASLIVLMPVAVVLMRILRKDIEHEPSKAELWVRRWILVLTVFVSGAAVIGDLITLVNYFLGGDLTMRFILKVIVLLLVAGAVFLHFLADLKGYWVANPGRAQLVGYGAAVVVILAIIAGFFIMGSPAVVRLLRFDDQKISDLQSVQYQVVNFWQQKERLPNSIEELNDPLSGWMMPKDPQGQTYRYEKTGDTTFKLCATFNKESSDQSISRPVEYGMVGENWVHQAGDQCFDRTIDPERYPPYAKPVVAR